MPASPDSDPVAAGGAAVGLTDPSTPGDELDDWGPPSTATRFKQAGVIVLGFVLAGVMMVLGVWQFRVFQESGDAAVAAQMAQPALDLVQVAPAGSQGGEAYGRTVVVRGSYAAGSQVLVPDPVESGKYRVVTALVTADGTAVAVVRGVYRGDPASAPTPPSGIQEQQGLFLPSEATTNDPVGEGQISSVRVSVLAQHWSWPLVGGFVTLDQGGAASQGLGYEMPALPREGGELRNGAYAVQWWVFAAFAIGFGFKMARDFGREGARRSPGPVVMGA